MAYVGNGYAWWVGQDGNIWANVGGDVKKLARGSTNLVRPENNGQASFTAHGDDLRDTVELFTANQIDDPNVSRQPQGQADDYWGSSATGSGSTYDKNAVDYWNSVISEYDNKLNGLDGDLDNANRKTLSDYDTKNNELQSSFNRNKSTYDQDSLQNQKLLQTNKNKITSKHSQGLSGLLRILGAHGAGGSSEALYDVPQLVVDQANAERADANSTFSQNQQKLDTNWGNYQIDFENDKKKLEDWKNGQLKSNEQASLNERNGILGQLRDAYAQRASAGQSAGNRLNELAEQIKSNQNRLNQLKQFTQPQYNGVSAVYSAPSLSSYDTGNASVTSSVNPAPQAGFRSSNTPTLAMLLGTRRKNSNPYGRE